MTWDGTPRHSDKLIAVRSSWNENYFLSQLRYQADQLISLNEQLKSLLIPGYPPTPQISQPNQPTRLQLILDASVLLTYCGAVERWLSLHELFIPLWTLAQLDSAKRGKSSRAAKARAAVRFLDKATQRGGRAVNLRLQSPEETYDTWTKCEKFLRGHPRPAEVLSGHQAWIKESRAARWHRQLHLPFRLRPLIATALYLSHNEYSYVERGDGELWEP